LIFFVEDAERMAKYKEINFEGLDTHCEVYLNGEKILESHNMFRRY
jgi:beta-galactosidase/beta-glucuronidase